MSDHSPDHTLAPDCYSDRWPKAGDCLLSPARGVYLAEAGDERSYRLRRGYKRAGDILVGSALADRADLLNLLFPALFNYRQYIELALKSIIEEHGGVANVRLEKRNHKLPELWVLFVKMIDAFGSNWSDEALAAVGSCVAEIDCIDPGSTVFR